MAYNDQTQRPEPMRVLVLGRLSKKLRDGTQTGLETQDAGMVTWAGYEGHTVTAVVGDFKSGTIQPWHRTNARPWLTDPEKIAQYDAVAAWRFDRLSRGDKQSTNEIEEWARSHGKMLLTEDGLVFPSEGVDGIRWDISARMAHDEWMKIRERAIRAQKKLRAGGFLVGRAPYGYRIVTVDGSEHKTLEHDPVTGPVVQQMARDYLAGETLQSICDDLNERHIQTPANGKRWTSKIASQVLRNPAIAGRRKDGLKFAGLITLADYQSIIRRMDSRAHRTGISPGNTSLLTSVLYCEKCQHPMYRIKTRDGLFYYCKSRKGCRVMVPVADADAWATGEVITGLALMPYRETIVIPGNDHRDEIDQLAQDIQELDPRTTPGWLEKVTAMNAELERLNSLPAEPDEIRTVATNQTIAQRFTESDTVGRRAMLLRYGRVYYDGTTYRPAFGFSWPSTV